MEAPVQQGAGQGAGPGAGTPPPVEKFGAVGRNSLDIFSPTREGPKPESGF